MRNFCAVFALTLERPTLSHHACVSIAPGSDVRAAISPSIRRAYNGAKAHHDLTPFVQNQLKPYASNLLLRLANGTSNQNAVKKTGKPSASEVMNPNTDPRPILESNPDSWGPGMAHSLSHKGDIKPKSSFNLYYLVQPCTLGLRGDSRDAHFLRVLALRFTYFGTQPEPSPSLKL